MSVSNRSRWVEAVSLKSARQFPRHSHDQFGIGVINSGGHRSWSGIGWVEAVCGDIIMVNPGEMHDGSSLGKSLAAGRCFSLSRRSLSKCSLKSSGSIMVLIFCRLCVIAIKRYVSGGYSML